MMKALVLYYSYGGNTDKIVNMIKKELDADIERIDTVTPYSGSYNDIVDQGQDEVNSGYMPEINPVCSDVSRYDTIIIGTPVWWYTFAPAIKTLLNMFDFSGKNVYPFATNGGWIGHTFEDFKAECENAEVKKGMNIRFDENRLITPEKEIHKWISSIQ